MSLALIGGLVGLAFAVVEYFFFGALIARAEKAGRKGTQVLDLARKAQLILFPVIGFVVGAVFAGENGA